MKTMRLTDGDLSIGLTSDYDMVRGVSKVAQDIRCALLEPLGNDRFHPGYGSDLESFIARSVTYDTRMEVQSEVNRVVGNYAAVQRDKIEADMYSGEDTRYSTEEVVSAVSGISVDTQTDSMSVTIGLTTVSGDSIVVSEVI